MRLLGIPPKLTCLLFSLDVYIYIDLHPSFCLPIYVSIDK
jgi:hypothetical protein